MYFVAGIKPFIEVSIVERIMEHSKVRQYKYYKMLIQEFHVKVDMGLIDALMGMFPQQMPTEQEAVSIKSVLWFTWCILNRSIQLFNKNIHSWKRLDSI